MDKLISVGICRHHLFLGSNPIIPLYWGNRKEKAALLKYGIVAFYLGGDKLSIREMASQLINGWDKMEACAIKQQKKGVAGAFVIRPRGGKIEEIPLT